MPDALLQKDIPPQKQVPNMMIIFTYMLSEIYHYQETEIAMEMQFNSASKYLTPSAMLTEG